MKNNKPRKWETLYERVSKQGQNAELVLQSELETEYYEKNKNSKEDRAKVAYKMNKQAKKVVENLPKVKNILELRELLTTRHKAIQFELNQRKENKKLEEEMTKLNEEYETITFKLKETSMPEKERKQLEKQLEENRTKRDENNKRFLKNNKDQSEIDFSGMDDKKLRQEALQLSTKISMCNMTCNSLMKGESWQTIEVQLANWDNVRLTADKENTEKLEEMKGAKKEEKLAPEEQKSETPEPQEQKSENPEPQKEEKEETSRNPLEEDFSNFDPFETEETTSAKEEQSEEEQEGEEQEDGEQGEEEQEGEENKDLVESSEFERKHPILASIKRWFDKVFGRKEVEKEDNEEKDLTGEIGEEEEEQEEEEQEENKKMTIRERIANMFKRKPAKEAEQKTEQEAQQKAEELKKAEEDKKVQAEKTQREDFISYLKDVADKGLDGIEEERKTEAAKTLLENKQQANGEIDMKSFKRLEKRANKDGGR